MINRVSVHVIFIARRQAVIITAASRLHVRITATANFFTESAAKNLHETAS